MAGFLDGLNTDAADVWATHVPSSRPANFSATMITTSMETALATWIDDNGMPAYTAPPSANAGNAGMHGGIGGGGEGNGNGVMGLGGLGVVTMLIMLYNLCAAFGLGLMWWKGVIDWKGNNTRQIANITLDDNVGNRTTMTVTVTDNSGTEWYVPLTWIDRAVQRVIAHNDAVNRARRDDPAADNDPNLADVTFELESDDGTTGHLRLSDVLDATTDAAGSHDAEAS